MEQDGETIIIKLPKPELSDFILHAVVAVRLGGRFSSLDGFT